MADERKIFPLEKVLELVTGKDGADVGQIASFLLGRDMANDLTLKAAAPFANAWLVRWFPKFMSMEWNEGESWNDFVKKSRAILGDNISLPTMYGHLKAIANDVIDTLEDSQASLARQTAATVRLEDRVRELEPLEARMAAVQKKNEELEKNIQAMKAEIGGLNRKVAEFQGKMPVDHSELMQNIKDAIKDGLKGLSVGTAVASTIEAAADSDATNTPQAEEPAAEFGFGPENGDADGFGF